MRSPATLSGPLCLALALAACGGGSSTTSPDASADAPPATLPDATPDAAAPDASEPDVPPAVAMAVRDRPYTHRVPSSYTAAREWPLVVLLHGYGASGGLQSIYLGLTAAYERRGFLLATPDGTLDTSMRRFWNATDACCNFGRVEVDDVAYVTAIITDMAARYRVDRRRVFVVGHSNGGFMAHRIAYERSALVAGIVSLAGAAWADPARCMPTDPVAVLQVHGTTDSTIRFGGGSVASGTGRYPSAMESVALWGRLDRCGAFRTAMTRADLDTAVAGAETAMGAHVDCAGGAAELWTMEGVGHLPAFGSMAFADAVFDWLMAHPKPAR